MRVAWYDEVIGPGAYEEAQEDGWVPPGVYYHKTKEEILELDPNSYIHSDTIPFNTKGLMYIDYWSDPEREDEVWYQLIWEDRTIWMIRDWLVLTKAGNGEKDDEL